VPLKVQSEILKDNRFGSGMDLLYLFSIFDGIPKYIEELIDLDKGSFKESILERLLSFPVTINIILLGDVIAGMLFGLGISAVLIIPGVVLIGYRVNVLVSYRGCLSSLSSFSFLGVFLASPSLKKPIKHNDAFKYGAFLPYIYKRYIRTPGSAACGGQDSFLFPPNNLYGRYTKLFLKRHQQNKPGN